jgi:hypothetical protein
MSVKYAIQTGLAKGTIKALLDSWEKIDKEIIRKMLEDLLKDMEKASKENE